MIIYFKVGNYKSIHQPLTLNFNAASIDEHEASNLHKTKRHTLLKSIVLYGHNASGKSKILDALVQFRWMVINSAKETQNTESINVESFQLSSASIDKPSFFEVGFILDSIRYRYGFEADSRSIHREWLLESKAKKEYPVFMRIGQDFQIDYNRFENSDKLEKRTRSNALFLSVATQWNVSKAQRIDAWFASIFTIHGLSDDSYRKSTIDLLNDQTYNEIINTFVKKADLGISSIEMIDIPISQEDIMKNIPEEMHALFKKRFKDDNLSKVIFSLHKRYDENKSFVEEIPFHFDLSESEGTKKYFNLIGLIVKSLLEGRLVIMDEFDARLHTLLSKAILKLYNSGKFSSSAQLLVASHDTALLDRDILRRDQIYFVEKDKYGATSTTSLVEYKARKESPYDKNYLDGKYGAIPFVDDLETLIADVQKQ